MRSLVSVVFGLFLMLFGALCLCSFRRIAVLLSVTLCFFILYSCRGMIRGVFDRIGVFIRGHSKIALSSLLLVGVLLRVGYLLGNGIDYLNTENWGPDYQIFWAQVQTILSGKWVETKSWTTLGFYSLIAYFSNCHILVVFLATCFLHCMTACVYCGIGRILHGKVSGVVLAALYLLNPIVIAHSVNVATEQTYSFFVALSILFFVKFVKERLISFCCVAAVLLGWSAWLATWSRGEGVLILPAAVCSLLICYLCRVIRWSSMIRCNALLFFLFAIGCVIGISVNMHLNGTKTIFCSNDNFWPRLFGANEKAGGCYNRSDMVLMRDRYMKDHPDCEWAIKPNGMPYCFTQMCPKEIVPYMKEEISNRWRRMPLQTAVTFVFKKLRTDFSYSPCDSLGKYFSLLFEVFPVFYAVALILIGGYCVRGREVGRNFVEMIFLAIFLCGDVLMLSLTECAPRYGWLLVLLGPLFLSELVNLKVSLPKFGRHVE